jgi:predicted dehydrogenase
MRSINRRTFLHQAVGAVAGGAAMGSTAQSYARIVGANDRLSLGHVGIGNRGRGLEFIVSKLKDKMNVEVTAVCDIWKVNREHAASTAGKTYGRAPRTYMNLEDMLALKDVDAVIISTPEHQHSPMLKMVAEADKHAYVEKPMGNVLEEAKAARDAVLTRDLIVQVGTQRRSEPYQVAAREWYRQGVTGDVNKIEIVWDYQGPRWRGRPEVKHIREEDTDWKKWLMTKPYRPFDPQLYFEYRLYKEFSSGIVDQWMSHAIDMVHWFMDEHFPVSVDANGGIFAWHDGRENPDTFQTLLTYPKGFLVSYATSFGNDYLSFFRIMGKKGTLINFGPEGTPRWKWVEEKGDAEATPDIPHEQKWLSLPGDGGRGPGLTPDEDLSHMTNWLEALRASRQPSAPVQAGYAHSVACIMAARAYWEGRRLYWNPGNETIVDQPPALPAKPGT